MHFSWWNCRCWPSKVDRSTQGERKRERESVASLNKEQGKPLGQEGEKSELNFENSWSKRTDTPPTPESTVLVCILISVVYHFSELDVECLNSCVSLSALREPGWGSCSLVHRASISSSYVSFRRKWCPFTVVHPYLLEKDPNLCRLVATAWNLLLLSSFVEGTWCGSC